MKSILPILSLLCVPVLFGNCKKTIKPTEVHSTIVPPALSIPMRMGNLRHWHGVDEGVAYGSSFYDSINCDYALLVLNDSMLRIKDFPGHPWDCTYKITGTDSAAKAVKFMNMTGTNFTIIPPMYITYYYEGDSIMIYGNGSGVHGNEYILIKTP